jgi:hypothetical protein
MRTVKSGRWRAATRLVTEYFIVPGKSHRLSSRFAALAISLIIQITAQSAALPTAEFRPDTPQFAAAAGGAAGAPPPAPAPLEAAGGSSLAAATDLGASAPLTAATLIALARQDPVSVTRLGAEQYKRTIRDYRAVFQKQERIDGRVRPVEEIEVLYREKPVTVFMKWRKNADKARRVLYVDSPENVDAQGRRIARVEPNGAIVRLFVDDIMMPINGPEAREASRRTIDEFGFARTFGLLERFNTIGAQDGVLDFKYQGEGQIDGRKTIILARHLPYTGETGKYPDALMVLHLDQEWLLPVAVHSFADHAGMELLGSYVFTSVQLNPGLTDADFRF